ncbi:MAG: 3-dehydroquinate synthase [Lachnospiraceae bacterium]|nr:3-dehydroquinate synthase [Lachnospiraceae bacterium]
MSNRIEVAVKNGIPYDIVLESNFDQLQEELNKIGVQGKKVCIVTDNIVNALYADTVKNILEKCNNHVVIYVFKNGEQSKNLKTIESIYETLIENHFERGDFLVALGGGVVGDMTGYTAATYLRGIDFIQIPTTLLAQVDSSIGGKTGVDFKQYKNMIGAFKMPRLVYMNLSVLQTLDERQFFGGFAEAMKSAIIKDASYYEWLIEMMYEICEKDLSVLEELVFRSCNIKRMIVEKDPFEKGERALLNFGHTLGHAIEKYTNFTMLHGECVALGCVAAAYISWKREMLSMEEYYEIRDMFVPFNLPISIEDIDIEKILSYTKSDKKMENNQIKFILLKKIGKAVIDNTVTDEEMKNALKEIQFIDEND